MTLQDSYLFSRNNQRIAKNRILRPKKKLGCIFSEKLVLEKGKVATYEFTKPIQVLLNASKVFKNSGTKKEVEIYIQIQSK
ncbi:MAG: hypothetical protein ACOC2M_04670 [bacterium]